MRYKLIDDADTATYVVVCDPGDDTVQALTNFVERERLQAAQLSAIGAFSAVTVGWLDPHSWTYQPIAVDEQCEVLSLLGDVAVDEDGAPVLHLHVTVGLSDGTTRGGHVLAATVNPTLEVIVRESPARLRKVKRAGIPIPTIDIDGSDR